MKWLDIFAATQSSSFAIGDDARALVPNRSVLESDDTEITGISTDTRTIEPGNLYIALTGESFDGHQFVEDAFAKGAAGAVVQAVRIREFAQPGRLLAGVKEPLHILGAIACAWRNRFKIPVVAVTGSVGKTTSKELIACALSPLGPVLKTQKNENNEIGLPKTLLRLDETHRSVVVEMGMRGAGQISYLTEIARPTIGIITTIGESHIELLGSRDAIASAKAELFRSHSRLKAAVYNCADDYTNLFRSTISERQGVFDRPNYEAGEVGMYFGPSGARSITFTDATATKSADVEGAEELFALVSASREGDGWRAIAVTPDHETIEYRIASPARHDLLNALSAIAVAYAAGVAPVDAARAVEAYAPGAMRMETIRGRDNVAILSDCYNAAPTSMRAALDTLAASDVAGRKIAFIGDMKELGEHAPAMHAAVISHAAEIGLTELYVVGDEFSRQEAAVRARFADSADAALYAATLTLTGDDIVLVKGSRSMAMEAVVDALRDKKDK
jgi:UDP-N-acetylmuramyl pentapeptide synthase